MMQFRLAPASWKWLIVVLALGLASLMLLDVSRGVRPVFAGEHGSVGAVFEGENGEAPPPPGNHFLTIRSFTKISPLREAGAQPGDQVRFDHPLDRWRKFSKGEEVGLTLAHAGQTRHITLHAELVPLTANDYLDFGGRVALALVSFLFCLMIAVKQAHVQAYRSLARTFFGLSTLYFINFNYSTSGPVLWLGKILCMACYPLLWAWCASFVLRYCNYKETPLRNWLNRVLVPYRVLTWITAAYSVWWVLGAQAPMLWLLVLLSAAIALPLCLASLLEGWIQSSGEMRQRHLWLVASLLAAGIPGTLIWIPDGNWELWGVRMAVPFAMLGQLLMYFGLAYAVLKHRVFNFDFAINRAMVYSVVSVLLLCTVGLMEFVSKALLKGDGNTHKSLLMDASIALTVYLIFHQLHGRIEKWVEKIFFYKWHENEHKLRDYVRQAAHFTAVEPLLSSFRTAIDRFTGQAGCAIYLRQPSGMYALVGGTLNEAPEEMDFNHELIVRLRADMNCLHWDDKARVAADLVLPMSHRGTLNGFVLLGYKPSRESYRPDEIEVLAFAAHQIGLDIHALRVEVLESEVRALELQADQARRELEIMAGRRRSARTGELSAAPSPSHDLQSSA